MLESEEHLLRLLQEIPLGEADSGRTNTSPDRAELVQITSFRQVAMPVAQDAGEKLADDTSRDEDSVQSGYDSAFWQMVVSLVSLILVIYHSSRKGVNPDSLT